MWESELSFYCDIMQDTDMVTSGLSIFFSMNVVLYNGFSGSSALHC